MEISKKSQGLPLQTIVILVLVIVALAAILMFFFGGFGKSGASLNDQQALSKCQSRCTRARAIALGTTTDTSIGTDSDYCSELTVEGESKKCDQIMSCELQFSDGTTQLLTC